MSALAGPALLGLIYAVGAYALGMIIIDALNLRSWRTDDEWEEPTWNGEEE